MPSDKLTLAVADDLKNEGLHALSENAPLNKLRLLGIASCCRGIPFELEGDVPVIVMPAHDLSDSPVVKVKCVPLTAAVVCLGLEQHGLRCRLRHDTQHRER